MTLKKLSSSSLESLEKATAQYQAALATAPEDHPAKEWLRGAVSSQRTSEDFRLGLVDKPFDQDHEQFIGRLCIPNILATPYGEERVVGLKFRNLAEKAEKSPKFLSPKGQQNRLYNLRALATAYDTLVVTEGESDTWAATAAGLHAIGVPGVNNYGGKHHEYRRRIFSGFTRVILCRDNDEAADTLAQAMIDVDGLEVRWPPEGFKDIREALVAIGPEALKAHILGESTEGQDPTGESVEDQDPVEAIAIESYETPDDDYELSEDEEYELEHGYGPPPF